MKIILNEYVEHLGERGTVVEVAPGYARNYLVPKGLAYPDTIGNRRRFEVEQKRWEEGDLKRRSAADQLARDMSGLTLKFERRAGEKDVLFGSVTAVDVAKMLAERGFDIDKRRVQLDDPIKELGSHEVAVQIYRDVQVPVTVSVVRPGGEARPAEPAAEVDSAPAPEDAGA